MDLGVGREQCSKLWPLPVLPGLLLQVHSVSDLHAHSVKVMQEGKQFQLRDHHAACGLRQEHTWLQCWAGRDRHRPFSTCPSPRNHFHRHGRHPPFRHCRASPQSSPPTLPRQKLHTTHWGVWEAAPGQTPQLPIVPTQSPAAFQNINEPQIVVCLWLISRALKWLLCQFCPVLESLSFEKRIGDLLTWSQPEAPLFCLLFNPLQSFSYDFYFEIFQSPRMRENIMDIYVLNPQLKKWHMTDTCEPHLLLPHPKFPSPPIPFPERPIIPKFGIC